MTSIELKRLARRIARLEQGQANMSKPQLAYSSIENGNIKSYEGDNLKMSIGLQDDGSSTMRFFDGPVPPVPAGFTALADGPVIQGTWDGSFVDGLQATYDLAYLEVAATLVDDDSRVSFATITAKEGASATLVANQSGLWAVAVRSVSQAGKKSEFASAGTVEVKLVDLAGAIEAVQDSANGKNKVTYSDRPPTPEDPGIFDDTWFVGQVGRPNDVIEATNLATNPSFEGGVSGWTQSNATAPLTSSATFVERMSGSVGSSNGLLTIASGHASPYASARIGDTEKIPATPGTWVAVRAWAATEQTGEQLRVQVRVGASSEGYDYFATSFSTAGFYTGRTMLVSFQVPAGKTEFRPEVQLYSGSPSVNLQAGKRMWIDGVNIVSAGSEEKARSLAGGYFDGDSPSGVTDNESHYRWTGTPHASTSEKYLPALDIGASDNWNVIEQYRHDGTGWVKVELSHYVFSTVDLGKATVGELDGIRIMAKTIGTEQLRADFADFVVARGATLIAGNDRHRLDDNGYALFDANGDRRTFLSPDGSTFKGEVEAETLVVNEGAEFKANNTLAQGAKLTLAAGVTDPTAPPVVQPFWGGLELSTAVDDAVGLAFDGTNYITARRSKTSTVTSYRQHIYGYRINASTGAVAALDCNFETAPGSPNGNVSEVFGVTCIGTELFWLGRYGYSGYVWVTDLFGVFKRRLDYPDLGYENGGSPLTYKPGIGNDGTNIVVAQCNDAGPLNVRTYNKTTGALVSRAFDTGGGTRSDITGVYGGNADWGRKLNTVAQKRTDELTSFNPTTGAYDGDGTKFNAAATGSTGVVFVDGKFRTLDPAGKIHEYADRNTGDASGDWWATYYWYTDIDDDNIIESTDYQSRMAPPARFTWPRRSGLKILGQPMPDGVEALGPALAKKTTTPVRTDFSGPGWQVDVGKPSARYASLPTNWTTFASPSATNTFPEAESSVLESASGTFKVQGDGAGYWGPLKMGRNGVMSGLVVTGQASCAVTTAGTPRKFTIQFPAGRFTKPPVVWLSPLTSSPQNVAVSVVGADITTTSFALWFWRNDLSGTGVDWFAMDSE